MVKEKKGEIDIVYYAKGIPTGETGNYAKGIPVGEISCSLVPNFKFLISLLSICFFHFPIFPRSAKRSTERSTELTPKAHAEAFSLIYTYNRERLPKRYPYNWMLEAE
ncbi:MAG: hypothetical protein DRP89_08815 [Candidatus Neomarinimicrobiota bacterium]|nr:MAG: hypothetical protein DRP89_08815 [Candidatus Neomarinimicrobiota bacterium]